ncbi:GNAT family N-acetyltransferase [Micrococcus sp.]|uniref:GNAT family N-acetyltransferase n=1 Tax=Micrococcus sp. TaxID=1271 RepID=UPI0026DAEA4C|nr:GNAT family N-acetyltransferase [Micrococcus sp.]MDO4239044.1 GNAT family N-acetyltransferase [Micrococcus sp.]MDO4239049.1 GNAT family N-acetyltransferase [Micrococcus sp.]
MTPSSDPRRVTSAGDSPAPTRTLEQIWPPYGLVVESGDLRMTALREADVPEVLDVVAGGIHDPAWTPFLFPWTDAPAEEMPANYVRFFASTLTRTVDGGVSLELVVRRNGRVVGMQGLNGPDVARTRRLETGSWLGLPFQGQGLGTRMRRMVCALAFDGLGLDAVTSSAWMDNTASRRVSEKVGYRETGRGEAERRGVPTGEVYFELRPEEIVRGDEPVRITGAEELRRFLGLDRS